MLSQYSTVQAISYFLLEQPICYYLCVTSAYTLQICCNSEISNLLKTSRVFIKASDISWGTSYKGLFLCWIAIIKRLKSRPIVEHILRNPIFAHDTVAGLPLRVQIAVAIYLNYDMRVKSEIICQQVIQVLPLQTGYIQCVQRFSTLSIHSDGLPLHVQIVVP